MNTTEHKKAVISINNKITIDAIKRLSRFLSKDPTRHLHAINWNAESNRLEATDGKTLLCIYDTTECFIKSLGEESVVFTPGKIKGGSMDVITQPFTFVNVDHMIKGFLDAIKSNWETHAYTRINLGGRLYATAASIPSKTGGGIFNTALLARFTSGSKSITIRDLESTDLKMPANSGFFSKNENPGDCLYYAEIEDGSLCEIGAIMPMNNW